MTTTPDGAHPYRRTPMTVEAIQSTPATRDTIAAWVGTESIDDSVPVPTSWANIWADDGYWVVRLPTGEFDVLTDEEFRANYRYTTPADSLHTMQHEQAVLGNMLFSMLFDDPELPARVALVNATDFEHPHHQAVFAAIAALVDRGETVDPVTVAGQLDHDGHPELPRYLTELTARAGQVTASRDGGHA